MQEKTDRRTLIEFAVIVVLAAIALVGYKVDANLKRASAPNKVQAFVQAFGYKLTVNEVLNPYADRRISHQLVQNLVDKELGSLVAVYDQKCSDIQLLRNEREKTRRIVPQSPKETAETVAKFNSVVDRIKQLLKEREAIKASWVQKGSAARDCNFSAAIENEFDYILRTYRESVKKDSAGSEPRSGYYFFLKNFGHKIINKSTAAIDFSAW